MAIQEVDVLIIGAGVVGLTLAHSLHQNGISYQVLERDASLDERGNGWGITLQWAKPELQQCIPQEIFEDMGSITVDLEMNKKDAGTYKFLNLETLERRCLAPAYPDRLRVRREGLRKLLATGVNLRWSSKISSIDLIDDGVSVSLEDGSRYKAKVAVGCDGSNSSTRRILCPDTAGLQPLPFRFIGVIVELSVEEAIPIQKIDPLAFQGIHPESGVYMFYSTVSTPETNGSSATSNPYYTAQCCVSWKPELGEPALGSRSENLKRMRELCSTMAPPIRDMVNKIEEGSEAIGIKLQDWPCLDWDNRDGRLTLAGDAAHAMTMYRGEAANYGIVDAARLAEKLIAMNQGELSRAEAIDTYEKELRHRSQHGVLLSRQACVDAHDFKGLSDHSPLIFHRDVNPIMLLSK